MLDDRLRFDKHAKYVRNKVIPKMKTLGKIRTFVSKKTALYLYTSLIKPVFEYNDYIYDPMTHEDANSLEVLQNTCLRICLKRDRYTSHSTLYEEAGIGPLSKSREDHTSKIVYLGLNQESTTFINGLFNKVSNVHGIATRSSLLEDVYIPRSRLECCKGNIKIRGPGYYNKLPEHVRHSKTVKEFNSKVKKL